MSTQKLSFKASADNFAKIPGSPIAYWAGEKMIKAFESSENIGSIACPRKGLVTTDNGRFLRLWYEVNRNNYVLYCDSAEEAEASGKKWFPINKGGSFRKWFGNNEWVVNWQNNGKEMKDAIVLLYNGGSYTKEIRSEDKYFLPAITWSALASGSFCVRYSPVGALFGSGGYCAFPSDDLFYCVLGLLNSTVADTVLSLLSPTLNLEVGHLRAIPIRFDGIDIAKCNQVLEELISLSRSDWDEYETSWDFKVNPLVREGWQKNVGGMSLEVAWAVVFTRRMEWAARMKELEEENNRLFIEAYGLGDELKPDVAWKDVSITGNPLYRYKVEAVEDAAGTGCPPYKRVPPELETRARADAVRELISYGIGCLMGRYSLEQEGLILASQGETYQDYFARVHGADKLRPDDDGIIPVVAGETAFTDNAPHRVVDFIKAAFGAEHLTENLNFIEATLGKTLETYLAKEFWDDHKRAYNNRPIYWLFRSKKGAFQALVYMHRMDAYTATKVRNGYLLPHIEFLRGRIAAESARGAELTAKERTKLKKMQQAIEECLEYDGRLHVVADRMQGIDLDDGVAVNYAKFGDVLAKLK